MKRILSIMLVLTISWTTFFIFGSEAFATGLIETKPVPSTTVTNPSVTPSQSQSTADDLINFIGKPLEFQSKAALAYYFNVLINDSYGVSEVRAPTIRFGENEYYSSTSVTYDAKPIRATSSNGNLLNCFNPDYLHDYFVVLCETADRYDADSGGFLNTYALENGYTAQYLGSSFGSTRIRPLLALKVLSADSKNFYFQPFSDYYNSLYAKYLSQNGELKVSVGYENTNSDDYVQPIKIPSEYFVNAINNNTTSIITSTQTFDCSWANNPLSVSSLDNKRTADYFTFMTNGDYFGIKDCKDIYGLPYILYNGIKYYSPYVFHFTYANEMRSGRNEVVDTVSPYPVFDVYNSIPSGDDDFLYRLYPLGDYVTSYAIVRTQTVSNSAQCLTFGSSEWYGTVFSLGTSYVKSSSLYLGATTNTLSFFNFENRSTVFFSSANIGETLSPYSFFRGDSTLGIEKPDFTGSVSDKPYNFGFDLSAKPFFLGFLSSFLDGSRIPQDSYITINNGDSVYDYSITNSTTGDTTNLGDFINHGYAWINTGSGTQNNQGSGSGNGGGTGGNGSGDLNVSGSVDLNVSGSVDINVSISGGGSGGSGNNGGDDGGYSNINDLTSNIPEAPSNFIEFLKLQMSWLPAPVLSLLIGGLTVVIIWSIIRRR